MSETSPQPYEPIDAWFSENVVEFKKQLKQLEFASAALGSEDPRVQFALGGLEATHRLLTGFNAARAGRVALTDASLELFGADTPDAPDTE